MKTHDKPLLPSTRRSAPPIHRPGVSESFIQSLESIGAPRELIEQIKRDHGVRADISSLTA